jgi:hypothetical protein
LRDVSIPLIRAPIGTEYLPTGMEDRFDRRCEISGRIASWAKPPESEGSGMEERSSRLIERSARLEFADIDFTAFRSDPLDESTLRCLRYMHDVEGHTACYLRDVLVTRAHRDPTLTAFMTCWAYEEHWHGEAIGHVLKAHEEPGGKSRLETMRARLPKRDAMRPMLFSVASSLSKSLPAVHMVWGSINEWSTQSGYRLLAAKAEHPVLSDLLHRIMRQEGRHIDFYVTEAKRRLTESSPAQRLARVALRHFWAPVGASVMPDSEVRFITRHLFGDIEGREAARRIDRQVDRLPGLRGLHLLEGVAATASRDTAA